MRRFVVDMKIDGVSMNFETFAWQEFVKYIADSLKDEEIGDIVLHISIKK